MRKVWSKPAAWAALCCLGSFAWLPAPCAAAGTEHFEELQAGGQEAIDRHDYVAAEDCFRRARAEAERLGREDLVRQMDARRAARYINEGEPSRGAFILEPYIGAGADRFMTADYLLALRLCNQPQKVLEIYRSYGEELPAYGLQTVGDVCLRQGKFRQAAKVYGKILQTEQPENVPYVQLGYGYALARMDKKQEALEAYGRLANRQERWNSIIASDAGSLLTLGKVNLARRLFALLGTDEQERESYRLFYARSLVEAGKVFQQEDRNFRRDEVLAGRSYSHEAEKLLRELEQSQDAERAREARVLRGQNFLQAGLYGRAKEKLQEALQADEGDQEALGALGEYDRTPRSYLGLYFENSLDRKGNVERAAGLAYEGYLSHDLFWQGEAGRRWLEDGSLHSAYWQGSLALQKNFEDFRLRGEWIHYKAGKNLDGFGLSLDYDLSDVTKLKLAGGRRLHEHAGAVRAGIREDYGEISLSHQLSALTSLEGRFTQAKLTDGNKFREYGLSLNHLLQVKHNFSDRLLVSYSLGKYDEESPLYDSPEKRVDYGLTFVRKWNLPRQNATLSSQLGLSWGRDNDEATGFSPYLGLTYVKNFGHGQQLELGAVYHRYFCQAQNFDESRRKDGFDLSIGYNWSW